MKKILVLALIAALLLVGCIQGPGPDGGPEPGDDSRIEPAGSDVPFPDPDAQTADDEPTELPF